LVRHHDYTLAVAEAVSGKMFSRFWLHGGHLLVDDKKMSKTKGNVFYPADLAARGFGGAQLRFFLIYGPYRKKLNFTFEKLAKTSQRLDSFRSMIADLEKTSPTGQTEKHGELTNRIIADFELSMDNDLDVKSAVDSLNETTSELYQMRKSLSSKDVKKMLNNLRKVDNVLQCIF
jgi:cysteinyl-tRNA synthetase